MKPLHESGDWKPWGYTSLLLCELSITDFFGVLAIEVEGRACVGFINWG